MQSSGSSPLVPRTLAALGDEVCERCIEEAGTHSLRRTKAALIYKQTGNLRAAQVLPDRTKIERTVRLPGRRNSGRLGFVRRSRSLTVGRRSFERGRRR